jgi:hypothetical protein
VVLPVEPATGTGVPVHRATRDEPAATGAVASPVPVTRPEAAHG